MADLKKRNPTMDQALTSLTPALRKLYILGTGGQAREMSLFLNHVNALSRRWEVAGFISADQVDVGKRFGAFSVIGDDAWLLEQSEPVDLVLGMGTTMARKKAAAPYLERPEQFGFPNVIHPSAVVDLGAVSLGQGNTIAPGCVFTCDIVIADFNHFNFNVTVGHDCRIGSYNVINPGANISGNVAIADGVLVGTGCQVLQGRSLASGATAGASALVTRDVGASQTVVGVPARPIQRPQPK